MKTGEAFRLGEDLPYKAGEVYRSVVVDHPYMKFVIAVMDAGTSFPEQLTLGNAMLFALEGDARVGYDGKETLFHAGEQFRMEKGKAHYVTAVTPFKMAAVVDLVCDPGNDQ